MEEKRQPRRRQPGASARRKPQKAPHAMPRRNPTTQPEPTRTAPEVVYMAPKPFSRNRLLLQLATIVAVVVAVLLGLSIFFRVENIEVSGCSQYTPWQIQQAAGIDAGDQLLTLNIPRAAAKITNQLRYVKTVRIGISLPDTVKIEIVETQVTYALQDQSGLWWLMDSAGKILDPCEEGKEGEHTVITGVNLRNPVAGSPAVALENTTTATDPNGGTVPVTVTAAQRLDAVKNIAANLERNGIIGDVAWMDVQSLFEVKLQYLDKFQVLLGDTTQMETKVTYLKSFVDKYEKEKPYEKGNLNLSNPARIEYDSEAEDEDGK